MLRCAQRPVRQARVELGTACFRTTSFSIKRRANWHRLQGLRVAIEHVRDLYVSSRLVYAVGRHDHVGRSVAVVVSSKVGHRVDHDVDCSGRSCRPGEAPHDISLVLSVSLVQLIRMVPPNSPADRLNVLMGYVPWFCQLNRLPPSVTITCPAVLGRAFGKRIS